MKKTIETMSRQTGETMQADDRQRLNAGVLKKLTSDRILKKENAIIPAELTSRHRFSLFAK